MSRVKAGKVEYGVEYAMSDDGSNGRAGSFVQSVKAVLWAFFGVRKRRDLEADAAQLNPLHVVVAALIGAALFIGVLILVVHAVVR